MVVAAGLLLDGPSLAQVAPPPAVPPPAQLPRTIPGEEVGPPEEVGRIVKIEDRRMTVELNDEEKTRVTFMVPLAAEVVLNKDAAKLTALRPADFVRVYLSRIDPKVAQRVVAARVVIDMEPSTVPNAPAAGEPRPRPTPSPQEPRDDQAGMGVAVAATPAQGILVTDMQVNGPADEAGIRIGDYLMAVGKERIPSPQAFVAGVQALEPGTKVEVTVWRDGKTLPIAVTLASRKAAPDIVGQQGLRAEPPGAAGAAQVNIAQDNAPDSVVGPPVPLQNADVQQTLLLLLQEIRALRQELGTMDRRPVPQGPAPAAGANNSAPQGARERRNDDDAGGVRQGLGGAPQP